MRPRAPAAQSAQSGCRRETGFRRADTAGGADPDLLEIAYRAPHATLCLTTALARHGLSDAIPARIDVALPRGQRRLVGQMLARLRHIHDAMVALDELIADQLKPWTRDIELLMTIPGVGPKTAQVFIAETGGDMSRFGSPARLAAWVGVAPAMHESAGHRSPAGTRQGNKWLASMLVEAATAVSRPRTQAPVTWHAFAADTFDLGRDELQLTKETSIGLYDPARCIIDAFRLRHLEFPETAIEALRRWLRRRGSPARHAASNGPGIPESRTRATRSTGDPAVRPSRRPTRPSVDERAYFDLA